MSSTDKNVGNQEEQKKSLKHRMFDIIGIGIMSIIILYSLSLFELRNLTLKDFGDIVIEWVPFFMAAVLLSRNYYTKGAWNGKETDKYIKMATSYSKVVEELNGDKLMALPDFCNHYNKLALDRLREQELQKAALSLDKYYKEYQYLSNKDIKKKYSEVEAKAIIKAKKAKVKGLTVNRLLSNSHSSDMTDIGRDEKETANVRTTWYVIKQAASLFILSLVGIKSIVEWGWYGLALTVFKTIFTFCSAYMSYFDGYTDITITNVNHMARKRDILKQHDEWYDNKRTKISNEPVQLSMVIN